MGGTDIGVESPSKSSKPVSIGGCCIGGGKVCPTEGIAPVSIPNKSSSVLSPAGCVVAMGTATSFDITSSSEGCSVCYYGEQYDQ